MIIKVIKKNPLAEGKQTVEITSVFFSKSKSGLIPEEQDIWIDTDRIELIAPPIGNELDAGCFSIIYSGNIIFIKDTCYEELLGAWKKGNNSNAETDEKYNEVLRKYQEIIELEKKNIEHKQCECNGKTTSDPEFPTTKRTGDNRPVTERILTMNDVLEELGPDHPLVTQYRHMLETTDPEQRDDYTATFLQLRMVCEALNEGWHATCTPGEWRYWPWFCIYKDMEEAKKYKWSEEEIVEIPEAVRCVLFGGTANHGALAGFAYASSNYAPSYADAIVGSRLCFKSSEIAMHAARHFHDLWLKYYFM